MITSPWAGGAFARAQQQRPDQTGADGVVGSGLLAPFFIHDCHQPIAAVFGQLPFCMGKAFKIFYLHRNQLSEWDSA